MVVLEAASTQGINTAARMTAAAITAAKGFLLRPSRAGAPALVSNSFCIAMLLCIRSVKRACREGGGAPGRCARDKPFN